MAAPIARVVSRAPVALRRRHELPDHPLQYRAALDGREPAEALTTRDRARLVAELTAAGWSVPDIAEHTRQTTYTTARIRDRLVAAGVTTPPNLEEKTA